MTNEVVKKEPTMAERFVAKVMTGFGTDASEVDLTRFQQRLAQNYCIAIDHALKVAEEKRKKKSEKYRDKTPITWTNVDMDKLRDDVISAARVGLDPAQKNHVGMMPFKNNTTGKYDIVFIEEYRGIELKAKKYGLDIPDHVIVELVYTTDHFKSIKKDRNNPYETFEFEVTDDFDRGEIKGGFYYHVFSENPEKNKLVTFNLKDILKRKPQRASTEFWGGEKDIWENGEKTGKKEIVDGWYEKMCWKTIYRAAYSDITIDSQKIDSDYMRLKQIESSFKDAEVAGEIEENANKEFIDTTATVIVDPETPPTDAPEPGPDF